MNIYLFKEILKSKIYESLNFPIKGFKLTVSDERIKYSEILTSVKDPGGSEKSSGSEAR